MKKTFLLTLGIISLISCKRVYQCECTRVVNGEDWNPIITNIPIEDQKKDAENACKSLGYSYGWQDYQGCKIK
jgi:hypothetical protein